MTLDATANPDVSQVESDDLEVEVNDRFPIVFSEKRPFFMEGLRQFSGCAVVDTTCVRCGRSSGHVSRRAWSRRSSLEMSCRTSAPHPSHLIARRDRDHRADAKGSCRGGLEIDQ